MECLRVEKHENVELEKEGFLKTKMKIGEMGIPRLMKGSEKLLEYV